MKRHDDWTEKRKPSLESEVPDYTRWLNASEESRNEEMFAGLYAELHKIARGKMAAERPGGTLSATGLVHEAWLRLENSAPEEWRDRASDTDLSATHIGLDCTWKTSYDRP